MAEMPSLFVVLFCSALSLDVRPCWPYPCYSSALPRPQTVTAAGYGNAVVQLLALSLFYLSASFPVVCCS